MASTVTLQDDAVPSATRTLTAKCFCQSVHFTITVPVSSLPLSTHLCNCYICRQVHGTLCCFHAPLQDGIQPQFVAPSSIASSVTRYRHAQAAADRLFCKTCGCHIGDEDLTPDPETGKPEWRVATSIFDDHGEDVFQIRTQCFTASEPGPGFADWLPRLGDRALRVWNPSCPDSVFPIPPPAAPKQEFDDQGHERLRAECHCGGVSFTIPRPTHPSVVAGGRDGLVQRYVSKVDPDKWVACLDVCDDCRLVTGAHVIPWTFVPLGGLEPEIPPDFNFGTLTTHVSSDKVLRAFCGTCGATVFFAADDPDRVGGGVGDGDGDSKDRIVDVAVGILRAPEGPAAEKWLTWRTGKLAWYKSGQRFDPLFAESLATGFREWGVREHGEALDFSIP